jgi:hypothetical protein
LPIVAKFLADIVVMRPAIADAEEVTGHRSKLNSI